MIRVLHLEELKSKFSYFCNFSKLSAMDDSNKHQNHYFVAIKIPRLYSSTNFKEFIVSSAILNAYHGLNVQLCEINYFRLTQLLSSSLEILAAMLKIPVTVFSATSL